MNSKVFFIHALTPVHSGTGQGAGIIDLPIAREKATGLPIIPASSIKGVLRAYYWEKAKDHEKEKVKAVFGPDTNEADNYSGSLCLSDARLLCLPVRSVKGVFAWVTSPYVLSIFARDCNDPQKPSLNFGFNNRRAIVPSDSNLILDKKLYLEDLDLEVMKEENNNGVVSKWANFIAKKIFNEEWQSEFKKRFAVLCDNEFAFLYDTAMEICARIKIQDESKTTQSGALWYEEALPAESILWGLAIAEGPYKEVNGIQNPEDVLKFAFNEKVETQLGGNATVGRGRVRIIS